MGCVPWEFDLLVQAGEDKGPDCCHLFRGALWWPQIYSWW